MPIVSRVAAMTSQAWGQFKNTLVSLAGNYLYVWGTNTGAALGIGTVSATVNRSSPVQVAFGRSFAQIEVGSVTTFGITDTGQLWAWGVGTSGILGDGTSVAKSSPVQIGTLTNWSQVSISSGNFVLAVKTDGTLWAWGSAANGVLGNGTTTPNLSSPVQIGTLTNWSKVTTSGSASMAVKTDGTLWSWGAASNGVLGNGTTTPNLSSPVQVGTLTTWSFVDAGTSSVSALKTDGTLWAWGGNSVGQLGQGNTTARSSPVQIGTLTNWNDITFGSTSLFAKNTPNELYSVGRNADGQLGLGDTTDRSSLVQVGTLTNWNKISAARFGNSIYTTKTDNSLWVWGGGGNGQLGFNSTTSYSSPVQLGTYSDITNIAVANTFGFFGNSSGTNYATGANGSGQLGQVEAISTTPVKLGRGIVDRKYSAASFGASGGMAVDTGGRLFTWGINTTGQLGNGATNATNDSVSFPTQIGTLTNWRKVYANDSIAMNASGDMYSWGGVPVNTTRNFYLGFGGYASNFNYPQRFTPYTISSFASDINNSGGSKHTLFVTSDGKLYAQGNGTSGRLGDGTTITKSAPVQIGTLTNWSKVAVTKDASAAIKTDGTLWTWGYNANGQLGDGTTVDKSSPVQIGTLTNWTDIASLLNGFSALNSNGELYSWGSNDLTGAQLGNLGIGSSERIDSGFSVPLQYGQIDFTDLSVGQNATNFAMGVDSGNRLWVWGLNSSGQLGFGDTTKRNSSAVQVGTLTNWSKVAASYSTAMAIKTDGTLWGWGANTKYQLGLGGQQTDTNRSSPVQMAYYNKVQDIFGNGSGGANGYVKIDGQLYGWGADSTDNLLGNNTGAYATNLSGGVATALINTRYGSDWSKISYNYSFNTVGFVLGIKTNGTLWAWGNNTYGQLGNGDNVNQSSPIQIGTLSNWSDISTGDAASYAIKTDGTLWSWGFNEKGALGQGDTTNRNSPVQIGTLTNWSKISGGREIAAFIDTANKIYTVGNNSVGQLGLGDTTNRSSLVQVGTLTTWNKVVCGASHVIAIKTDNSAWAWGSNAFGQLGDSTGTSRSSPVQIGTLTNWGSASATRFNSGAIKTDGTLWTWGRNDAGQLGDGTTTDQSAPVQIGTLTNWSKLYYYRPNNNNSFGGFAALTTDGTLYAAGYNTDGVNAGYLGIQPPPVQYSPVQIGTTTTWSEIIAIPGTASTATAALRSDGTLWTWGNGTAALANNGGSAALSPAQIGTLTNWSKLSGGLSFALAIKTDGTLWAWGNNASGQLGDGSATTRSSPVQIGTLTNWSSISAGVDSSLAVNNSGTLFTWGDNQFGQLGDGTTINRSSPVQIATSVSSASMGYVNMAYVTTGGAVFNTGTAVINSIGNTATVSSPIQIPTVTTYDTSFIVASYNFLAAKSTENNYLYIWAGSSVGNPTTGSFAFPGVYEAGKSSPTQIKSSANWTSARGLQSPGYLYTWGRSNASGELGLGDTFVRLGVTRVGTVNTWTKTAQPNLRANIALRADGSLWTWGLNASGQLGQGDTTSRSVPTQVGTLTNWTDVSSSESQQFAVNSSNQLWGVGSNSNYALGDGTTTNRSTFVQSGFSSDNVSYSSVVAVTDGGFATNTSGKGYTWGEYAGVNFSDVYSPTATGDTGFTTQYVKNGGLYMAGSNSTGELGTGDTFTRTNATRIGTLTDWDKVELSLTGFTIAIKTDGTLWSWGAGNNGYLGRGSTSSRSSPAQVGTLSNWSKIAVGNTHTLSIKTDGSLWAWGQNTAGQLGDGTTVNKSSPVQIGTLTNWATIGAFNSLAIAIKTDGTLWTWGAAAAGGLGNGTTTPNLSSPVQVGTLTTWAEAFDNGSANGPAYGAFATQ